VRVAVAGATGVLGRATLPVLRDAGHEVRGFSRRVPEGDPDLVPLDLLDRDAVLAFAREWRPEAIVHLATAIPARVQARGVDEQFAATNRLRTEGTRILVDAAREAGARRLVSQSISFAVAPGEGLADEEAPLWLQPPMSRVAGAIAELERLTLDAGGVALRFGLLAGPGTAYSMDGAMGRMAARGRLPILHRGGAEATSSFVHPTDAGRAVLAAIERDVAGVFNIVDDEPALASEWIPVLTAERGSGRKPMRVPAALARPLVGAYAVAFMSEMRGASNAKAKRELGWEPRIGWREAFAEG
jgi:nucleoside-diphosphate-sugar epimerase